MTTATVSTTDHDVRIPTPILCALWRVVEVWVFVVLVVKDRRIPSWQSPGRAGR